VTLFKWEPRWLTFTNKIGTGYRQLWPLARPMWVHSWSQEAIRQSGREVFFRPVKFQKQVNLSNSWPSLTQVTRFEEDDCCTLFPNKVKLIGPKLWALNSPPRIKWDTGPGQEQKDAGTGGRVPLGLSDGEAHVAVGAHAICRLLPLLHHRAGPYLVSLRLLLHSCCYHHFFNISTKHYIAFAEQ